MARAFVRVCIAPAYEERIRDTLRTEPEVISADITCGEQDLMAVVKGESFEEILNTVVTKIRPLQGVKITWTNFILE